MVFSGVIKQVTGWWTMDNDYVALTEDGVKPRDKTLDSAVVIKPARQQYEGQDVAVVRNADWVSFRDDVIDRGRHSPLVRAGDATDLAWWLYEEYDEAVFVGTELFDAS